MRYRYDAERDGITQGALRTFLTCRRLAELRLVKGWTTPPSAGMVYGTIIHGVLARMRLLKERRGGGVGFDLPAMARDARNDLDYAARLSRELEAEASRAIALAPYIMEGYIKHRGGDFSRAVWHHVEWEFAFRGPCAAWLRGKMDGVRRFRQKLWLSEVKTASQVGNNRFVGLHLDYQLLFYLYALRMVEGEAKVGGVIFEVIRNPAMKAQKGESLENFAARIGKDVAKRPEFYFFRVEVPVSEFKMEAFLYDIECQLRSFLSWFNGVPGGCYRSYTNCQSMFGPCPMWEACLSGKLTAGQWRLDRPFPELSE